MEPGAPEDTTRRPGPMSTGVIALTLTLLGLLGATVGLVLLSQNRDQHAPEGTGNGSEFLQMREVLEVIPFSSPKWGSTPVTCIASRSPSASSCLEASAAADRSIVLLSLDGSIKYRLGPSLISAADVARAAAEPPTGSAGWEVNIRLTPDASKRFADITTRLLGKQLAIVVDDHVVSAPVVAVPITSGEAVIVGGFTEERARDLAERLASHS